MQAGISDAELCDTVLIADRDQVDADLGGCVIKQRIARAGEDRSGGFRAIVLVRREDRAFFVHGFAKNEQENLRRDELRLLRRLAGELFRLDRVELEALLANGTISEVNCDGQALQE